MGVQYSYPFQIYSYKNMQKCIEMSFPSCIIINTIDKTEQKCLIKNTICISEEEYTINQMLKNNKNVLICIYGKHSCDTTVFAKYEQLKGLGFLNIHIYIGGLFEWLCLQDIYGSNFFPTTFIPKDILDYSPEMKTTKYIGYSDMS